MSTTTTTRATDDKPSWSSSDRPVSGTIRLGVSDGTEAGRDRSTRSTLQTHRASVTTASTMSPPPLDYYRSPYCCVPLPSQGATDVAVVLHPMLQSMSGNIVQFDMASPPQQVRKAGGVDLSRQPATSPSLPSLTIISRCLPWAIVVHGTSCVGSTTFVSVFDVLSSIHRALAIPVTPAEFRSATEQPEKANQSGSATVIESRGPRFYWAGMRRLHFLGGRQTFAGLSRSSFGAETWVLSARE